MKSHLVTYESLKNDSFRTGRNEKSDCGVLAISVVTGSSYETAWRALNHAGRQVGKATYHHQIDSSLKELGFKRTDLPGSSGMTMSSIERELATTFPGQPALIFTRNHVAGFDGEKLQDWTSGRRHRVRRVYLISKTGQEVPPTPVNPAPTPKPAPTPRGNLLAVICQELGVNPQLARRKLRKAGLNAPYTDREAILAVLSH